MKAKSKIELLLEATAQFDAGQMNDAQYRCKLVLADCAKPVLGKSRNQLLGLGISHLILLTKGADPEVMRMAFEVGARPGYEALLDKALREAF